MRKNTLNIIILTLCIINLVLNVLIIFSVIPTANRTNNMILKISEIIDLELKPEYSQSTLAIDQIDPRIITNADGKTSLTISVPSSDGKNHYAVVSATVSLDMTHEDYETLSLSFDNAMSLIVSKIDMVVSSYTYETVQESKTQIQEQLLSEIRSLFQSNMIYDVSLQILVQ